MDQKFSVILEEVAKKRKKSIKERELAAQKKAYAIKNKYNEKRKKVYAEHKNAIDNFLDKIRSFGGYVRKKMTGNSISMIRQQMEEYRVILARRLHGIDKLEKEELEKLSLLTGKQKAMATGAAAASLLIATVLKFHNDNKKEATFRCYKIQNKEQQKQCVRRISAIIARNSIHTMESKMGMCDQTKNPDMCRFRIGKAIKRLEDEVRVQEIMYRHR